ncbi:hypothetical protein [Kitasatospora indigofera]|uniref:hypothetical protein n=1 Tax=Kitasatospora indigofera TaxID=67307 RepID=UPI0036888817
MADTRDLQTLIDSVEPVAGEMLTVPDPVARRALSVVAAYARDVDDCRLLLQVLGLMPEDGQAGQGPAVGRTEGFSTGPGPGPVAGAGADLESPVAAPSPLPDSAGAVPGRRRLRP